MSVRPATAEFDQVLWDAPNIVEELLRPFVGGCASDAQGRT